MTVHGRVNRWTPALQPGPIASRYLHQSAFGGKPRPSLCRSDPLAWAFQKCNLASLATLALGLICLAVAALQSSATNAHPCTAGAATVTPLASADSHDSHPAGSAEPVDVEAGGQAGAEYAADGDADLANDMHEGDASGGVGTEAGSEAAGQAAGESQLDPEPERGGATADGDGAGVVEEAPPGPGAHHLSVVRASMQARSTEEMRKRGLPADSYALPHQPVWDPGAWQWKERPDPASEAWPNTVALCALMKDEHPDDVEEWLRYHRWLGVDRVFLAENAEVVPERLAGRLQALVDEGFLHLTTLPGPKHPLQNRWYNRCSKPDMAGDHSWVAFLDLDEYLVVLEEGVASAHPDLKAELRSFRGNAGLSLQWVLFGSSGHVERPPGGPLANFDKCTGKVTYEMKCVANMFHAAHHMFSSDTVHDCTFKVENGDFQNPPVVLGDGAPLRFYNSTTLTNPNNNPALGMSRGYSGHLDQDTYDPTLKKGLRLVLFHYATRSLQDYVGRKINMPAGIYAHTYAKYGKEDVDVSDEAVMREFERVNGFDGSDPVCGSAAGYAELCCSVR